MTIAGGRKAPTRAFFALVCLVLSSCGDDGAPTSADGGAADGGSGTVHVVSSALVNPACIGGGGLQAGSPWPMRSACPMHRGQSALTGAQTSAVAWSTNLGGDVHTAPAIAADGTIYAGNNNLLFPKFYALNPNGSIKWTYTGLSGFESSPAIAADGTVYVGNNLGQLIAFNPSNGSVKWTYTGLLQIDASPVIGSDGTIYIGSHGLLFTALNPNGSIKWSYLHGPIASSAAIASDGTIYVGADDLSLHAINSNGSLKWSRPLGALVHSSPSVALDGTIYVGADNGKLYALNTNGTIRWFVQTGSAVRSSPVIADDGTVYFGSDDKKVYAVNPSGSTKWTRLTTGLVESTPAIGGDGTVYIGSDDKKLYALRPADGSILFSVTTGGLVRSSPAIGSNGTVYFGSDDDKLYAVGPGPASCVPTSTTDTTCNGIDDNCNGVKDEGYVSAATSCGTGACARAGATSCILGVTINSCVAGAPAASDATCNGIDDNCNGSRDEGFVSAATSCGVGACTRTGSTSCVVGVVQNSCTAGTPAASDATCNGLDDNCNGATDEGFVATSTTCGTGACARAGASSCVAGAVANSCVAGTPAANDKTCNGVDDNCNGPVDEGYVPIATMCGVGPCVATGTTSCALGVVADSCSAHAPAANDLSCNGVDDNCNGVVDDGCLSPPVSPALKSANINPAGDTTIRSLFRFQNDGHSTRLSTTSASVIALERSLIKFSTSTIASTVGSGKLISATLKLPSVSFAVGWNGGAVNVHRMTKSWTEYGATWGCANDTDTSLLGNLLNNCTGSDSWSMDPGSSTLPYSTTPTDFSAVFTAQIADLSFDVTSDVKNFLSGQLNEGWMVAGTGDLLSGAFVQMRSREDGNGPKLVLLYDDGSVAPGSLGDNVRVSVPVSQDTFVSEWYPDTPRSRELQTNASSNNALFRERSLVQFADADIALWLGAFGVGESNYDLATANLVVTVKDQWHAPNPGNAVEVHRMLQPWVDRDATWHCRHDTNTANTQQDCVGTDAWDMQAAVSGQQPFDTVATDGGLPPSASGAEMSFEVTDDVNPWLTHATANYGWLIDKEDAPYLGFLSFYSKEGGRGARLELTFKYHACTKDKPCASGEGSCASNLDCAAGLVCQHGIEQRFGKPAGMGICWDPGCSTAPAGTDCGTASSRCGLCCSPTCSGTTCKADGCGGSCGKDCQLGDGCGDDSACAPGLACGQDNGWRFESTQSSVCWNTQCSDPPTREVLCGNRNKDCGYCSPTSGAPICHPECENGRTCGTNGCGGNCGNGGPCIYLLSSFWQPPEHLLDPSKTTGVGPVTAAFDIDDNGAATYTMPIRVPPGAMGIQPDLKLVYNSQRRTAGYLGVGWSLDGMSAITRCEHTVPRSDDIGGRITGATNDSTSLERNVYCLDGQRLIYQGESSASWANGTVYRYKTERDSFARIEFDPFYPGGWKIQNGDGRSWRYGDIGTSSLSTGTITDGGTAWAGWGANRLSDQFGNEMRISYWSWPTATTDAGIMMERYPRDIYYGLNHVEFEYEELGELDQKLEGPWSFADFGPGGADDLLDGEPGFDRGMVVKRRLIRVVVSNGADKTFEYELKHERSPVTKRDRVKGILECAYDGNKRVCKPEVKFIYSDPSGGEDNFGTLPKRAFPGVDTNTVINRQSDFRPIQADGISGDELLFARKPSATGIPNLFVLQKAKNNQPVEQATGITTAAFDEMDWNEDGRDDILYVSEQGGQKTLGVVLSKRLTGQPQGLDFGYASSSAYDVEAATFTNDVDIYGWRLADLNGDGRKDLLTCQDLDGNLVHGEFYVRFWKPGVGFGDSLHTGFGCRGVKQVQYWLRPEPLLLDVTGDGIPEWIWKDGSDLEPTFKRPAGIYSMNRPGSAQMYSLYRKLHRLDVANNPYSALDLNAGVAIADLPVNIFKALDINGDGLVDLVQFTASWKNRKKQYVAQGSVITYLNTGSGLRPAFDSVEGGYNTSMTDMAAAVPLDWNEDGKADLLIPHSEPDAPFPDNTWRGPHTWDLLVSDGVHFSRQETEIPIIVAQTGEPVPVPYASQQCATGWVCPTEWAAIPYRILSPTIADVGGDGRPDLIYPGCTEDDTGLDEPDTDHACAYVVRERNGTLPDLINEIREQSTTSSSSARPILIQYGLASDRALHAPDEACDIGTDLGCPSGTCVNGSSVPSFYPRVCLRDSLPIVAAYGRRQGLEGALDELEVEGYRGGFADRLGRGSLGFKQHWAWSDTRKTTHAVEFDNATRNATYGYYPFLGMKTVDAFGWATIYPFASSSSNPYEEVTISDLGIRDGGGGVFFSHVDSTSRILDQQGAVGASNNLISKTETTYSYDGFGYPNRIETVSKVHGRVRECSQTPCIPTTEDAPDHSNVDSSVTAAATESVTSGDDYFVGMPVLQVTTSCVPVPDFLSLCEQQSSDCSVNGSSYQDCATRTSARVYDNGTLTNSYTSPLAADQVWAQYEHDARGHVTKVTLAGSGSSVGTTKIVSREYIYGSDLVFPEAVIDETGGRHELAFDQRHGMLIGHSDPNGVKVLSSYDGFGRLGEEQALTRGYHATHKWSGSGEYPKYETTVDKGAHVVREYDYRGRLQQETADGPFGKPVVVNYTYNSSGLPWKISLPHKPLGTGTPLYDIFTYDDLGRVSAVDYADGHQNVTTFDPSNGRHFVATDGLGVKLDVERDALGRPVYVTEDLGGPDQTSTSYTYGPFGGLTSITDNVGHVTKMTRDPYGRVKLLDDPSLGSIKYEYNSFGEMELQTWVATGKTIQRKYDDLGRVFERRDADGVTKWTFDTRSHGHGLLSSSTSADGRTKKRYFYDDDALLEHVEYEIDGDVYPVYIRSRNVEKRIETLDLPSTPDGQSITLGYDYDDQGNLKTIDRQELSVHIPIWEAIETTDPVLSRKEKFGNSAVTTRTMYPETLLQHTIDTTRAGNTIQSLEFAYDVEGNMRSRTTTSIPGVATRSEHFSYDGLERLRHTYIQDGSGTHRDPVDIDIDSIGNIKSKSDVGTYGYGSTAHAVMSAGASMPNGFFAYDAYGNQKKRGNVELEFNAFNAVSSLHDVTVGAGSETQYGYDADQERAIKDGPVEKVLYAGMFERHVPKASGPIEHRYLIANGTRVVAEVSAIAGSPLSTKYLHDDHLGSTVATSDASGNIESFSYDAFGAPRDTDWRGPPPSALGKVASAGFTGHEHDEVEALGLINMRARLYDPKLGRFLSADPLADASSQGLNRYSYVRNAPLRFTDPTGLTEQYTATATIDSPMVGVRFSFAGQGPSPFIVGPLPSGLGGTSSQTNGPNGARRDELSFPGTIAPPEPSDVQGLGDGEKHDNAPPPPRPTPTAPDPLEEEQETQEDSGLTIGDVLAIGGVVGQIIAEMTVPGVGEAMDAMTLADPNAFGLEKGLAGISLAISAVTLGAGPNAGPLIHGAESIERIVGRGEREAAHAVQHAAEKAPQVVEHASEAGARRAALREAGIPAGTPPARNVPSNPGSQAPKGPRGTRAEWDPVSDANVGAHHDPNGHLFPDGSTIPPHYGVDAPGAPTVHHTYPSDVDPRLNR